MADKLSSFYKLCVLKHDPPTLATTIEDLHANPDCTAIYYGTHLEDPSLSSLVTLWLTPSGSDKLTTTALSEATSNTKGHAEPPAQLVAALEAPVTEVLSAVSPDKEFLNDNMRPFCDRLGDAKLDGHKGTALGEFEPDGHEHGKKGVRVFLGWESKDHHLRHKEPNQVIGQAVHMIRSGHQGLEMYHVAFEKM